MVQEQLAAFRAVARLAFALYEISGIIESSRIVPNETVNLNRMRTVFSPASPVSADRLFNQIRSMLGAVRPLNSAAAMNPADVASLAKRWLGNIRLWPGRIR
jgi:hypothetical protein